MELAVSGLIVFILGWLVYRIQTPEGFQPCEQFEESLYRDAKKCGRRIARIGLLMVLIGVGLIVVSFTHPF